MNLVGMIDVIDLTVVSQHYGRDFIPFPFMQRLASKVSPEVFEEHARNVITRFREGDLRSLQHWAGTYVRSDIRVEGQAQFVSSDKVSVRVMAHRLADGGYFARQTSDDVIEIFSLSPYDLGAAVAESMGTLKPGSKQAIIVPEYQVPTAPSSDGDGISIRSRIDIDDGADKVSRSDIEAFASIQSHWRPVRKWGVDRGKAAVVWVRVKDDGDYVYAPDYKVAQPVSKAQLAGRIDRLIADDVATVREIRRGI